MVVAVEVLICTPAVRNLIREGKVAPDLLDHAGWRPVRDADDGPVARQPRQGREGQPAARVRTLSRRRGAEPADRRRAARATTAGTARPRRPGSRLAAITDREEIHDAADLRLQGPGPDGWHGYRAAGGGQRDSGPPPPARDGHDPGRGQEGRHRHEDGDQPAAGQGQAQDDRGLLPAVRDDGELWPADPARPLDPGGSDRQPGAREGAGPGQDRCRAGLVALRRPGQAPQGIQQPVHLDDQGRRDRWCARRRPALPGRP